jgi:hypothetical protein
MAASLDALTLLDPPKSAFATDPRQKWRDDLLRQQVQQQAAILAALARVEALLEPVVAYCRFEGIPPMPERDQQVHVDEAHG